MINIGFLLVPTEGWLGGVNYFRNLFAAINSVDASGIRIVLFVPTDANEDLVGEMCGECPAVEVVRTRLLVRSSLSWMFWRIARRITGSDWWLAFYLRRYRISVFSHSSVWAGRWTRSVNWIPDFQHMYLPEYFPPEQVTQRNRYFREIAAKSDLVVVSSHVAADDLRRFAPESVQRAAVLQFVTQIPNSIWDASEDMVAEVLCKYSINTPYIYLPNQFWRHKNHIVVFKAIELLKQERFDVELVCTGSLSDFRCPEYPASIGGLLTTLNVSDRVKILGVVPYADVLLLMKGAACVINPSRFEGWSSTVEECKSIGKRLLLSDIAVHREQASNAAFFPPDDCHEVALQLKRVLKGEERVVQSSSLQMVALRERTQEYGRRYLSLIRSVLAATRSVSGLAI